MNAMASLLARGHPLSLLIVFFRKNKSQRIRRYGKGRLRTAVSWHHTSVVSPPVFCVAPFQTGITRCPVCLVAPFVPASSAVGSLACALCAVARASDVGSMGVEEGQWALVLRWVGVALGECGC